MKISLRKAEPADSDLVLALRNEEESVLNSLSSKPVSQNEHDKWFDKRIKDKTCKFFIAEDRDKNSIGTIRFDISDDFKVAEVSIIVSSKYRGKGYGKSILKIAINSIAADYPIVFMAKIKTTNLASIEIFKKCGFGEEYTQDGVLLLSNKQIVIDAIEKIRSRNNVNWMNLLRLAFKEAPKEAGEIMGNINSDDDEISSLLELLKR
tara:strand:+ start:220 stop:840 length:621 start_codon:yes stop_codon:yes gene_type:complete